MLQEEDVKISKSHSKDMIVADFMSCHQTALMSCL